MAKDPVCGMECKENEKLSAVHKGKKYYFCSPTCQWAFQSNPDRFVKKK